MTNILSITWLREALSCYLDQFGKAMAPNPRIKNAFLAMKAIGIPKEMVKPVLKNLLKLLNWELIEEENYRALADAIYENEEAEATECQKSSNNSEQEALSMDEPEGPSKMLCLKHQVGQPIEPPESHLENQSRGVSDTRQPMGKENQNGSDLALARKKGKQPVSSNHLELQEGPLSCQSRGMDISHPIPVRAGSSSGPRIPCSPIKKAINDQTFIKHKEVLITNDTILPGSSNKGGSSTENGLMEENDAFDKLSTMCGSDTSDKPVKNTAKTSHCLEVASSFSGQVKVILNCGSAVGRSEFHMPTLDAVVKLLEQKCVKKYEHLDPSFSVMKVMKDVCQCFLELGSESTKKLSAKNSCRLG